jgi:16S rRNA processing protein RimM
VASADRVGGRNRAAQTQLRVGRLTKAHGLKGGLKLELFTDDPDRRFTPGASFSLQVPETSPWHGKRLELAELRWYNGMPVGFFVDVPDRSTAESLVKAILWVDQDPEEVAEPDAWYDHQLVGLDVVRDGESVGTIDRLEHLPAQDLLVVKLGDREVLVPFVRAIVPEVDLDGGRVVVTPPDGLFEPLDDEPEPEAAEPSDAAESSDEGDAPAEQPAAEDDGTASTERS